MINPVRKLTRGISPRVPKIGNNLAASRRVFSNGIKKIILKFYNQSVEDFSVRLLYFLNTIDTYFLIAGAGSFLLLGINNYDIYTFLVITLAVWVVFKSADFYPLFLAFSPIFLFFLSKTEFFSFVDLKSVFLINLGIFLSIQFFFMSVPESIVARDPAIGLRKIWNSIFTIAPTTVSLPMSVFFSTLYSLILISRPSVFDFNGLWFWLIIFASAMITRNFRPISYSSYEFKPEINTRIVDRVIVLNIDGCRLDRFYEAKLPFLTSLQKKGSYFPKGIQTVYRALTNPAFASILTGAAPEVHGIKSNNLGQFIKVEALPDIVKAKLYGSMHVKHFSKRHWDTKIVSLPTYGVYKSDALMFDWLKKDLEAQDKTRLFIADISEADFLGHAYGSESRQYLEALKRADKKIEEFYHWLNKQNMMDNTAIIICSDHGIVRIDHSYLLFDAERYVPFIITGTSIAQDNPLTYPASIMDIAPTISYLLGIRYPSCCRGRVFKEAFI